VIEKVTVSSKEISMDTTVGELLLYLDSLLKTERELVIDVKDTDMEFVPSLSCARCSADITVNLPKYKALVYNGMFCPKCELLAPHIIDDPEPAVSSLTKYDLRQRKDILSYTLQTACFEYSKAFLVHGRGGNDYEITIVPPEHHNV